MKTLVMTDTTTDEYLDCGVLLNEGELIVIAFDCLIAAYQPGQWVKAVIG